MVTIIPESVALYAAAERYYRLERAVTAHEKQEPWDDIDAYYRTLARLRGQRQDASDRLMALCVLPAALGSGHGE